MRERRGRLKDRSVDAVILAGGLGTRLRSLIHDRPKALAPVAGVRFLDLLLHQLAGSGIVRRVVLAVGHQAEKVREAYASGERFGLPISLAIETVRLGTGGGVRNALPQTASGDVLVLNGDSFIEVDFAQLVAVHQRCRASATLTLTTTLTPERYGTVACDRDGRVSKFVEKSASTPGLALINAGVYLFRRDVLEALPESVPLSIETDILPALLKDSVFSLLCAGRFIDIGMPATYLAAPDVLEDLIEALRRHDQVLTADAGHPNIEK